MVKGNESKYQKQLEALISDLSAIDTTASYSAVDAMLILLREGVEALLIVMALVTVLKSAKLIKGLKWVYAGAFWGSWPVPPLQLLFNSYSQLLLQLPTVK